MAWLQSIDLTALLWIQNNLRLEWITPFWKAITTLGNGGWFWIVLSCILLIPKRTRLAGICGLLSMGLGFLIANLCLKPWIARIRPYDIEQAVLPLIAPPSDYSFPSGHTTASFACALSYLRYLPKKVFGVMALILAALIAWSRLYLGVHYPTDILGAVAVALLSSWIIYKLMECIRKAPSLRKK